MQAPHNVCTHLSFLRFFSLFFWFHLFSLFFFPSPSYYCFLLFLSCCLCGTHHTCSGECVWDNSARRGLGRSGVCVHMNTALRHTTSPHVAIWAKANCLSFCPSIPSRLGVGFDCCRPPTALGTHCCLVVCLWAVDTAARLVPFDHSGFYPFDCGGAAFYPGSGVVLVGSGPLTRGRFFSWYSLNVYQCTTPAIGQGSYALLRGCLIPKASVKSNCVLFYLSLFSPFFPRLSFLSLILFF